MKKVFFLFLMANGISILSFAQGHYNDSYAGNQQYSSTQYYYYPEANVYYHPSSSNYAYYDQNGWHTAQSLPRNFGYNSSMRYIPINYQGSAIWSDNSRHQSQYGGYNNGYNNPGYNTVQHNNNVSRREHRREHKPRYRY